MKKTLAEKLLPTSINSYFLYVWYIRTEEEEEKKKEREEDEDEENFLKRKKEKNSFLPKKESFFCFYGNFWPNGRKVFVASSEKIYSSSSSSTFSLLLSMCVQIFKSELSPAYKRAQQYFAESLAAYSVASYVFQIKDR